METKKNPKADLENKRGVYFLVGLVLVLAIVLVAFEWKTYEKGTNSLGELKVEEIEDEMIPITQQKPPPPPPPPPPPQEILEIVEDDKEIENEVDIADSEADMDTEIFEQPEEVIEEPEIFMTVEDMPVFPGCEDAGDNDARDQCTKNKISAFLGSNIKYPSMARDAGVSGTVYIRFIIDENGEVRDAEVLRGVAGGKSLDEEALRVINNLPKMRPGKQRGQPVRVIYNAPVRFNLK